MSPRIKPASPELPASGRRLIRLRPRLWAGLILIFGLGIAAHFAWQRAAPSIAGRAQYLVTPDKIHITPAPPWIRCDIKAEVMREVNLGRPISVLDNWPALAERLTAAFEFHPWVASVERISKALPSSLRVDLTYRRPVAAVESSDSGGVAYFPIDEHAIRLPETDFTDAERRHLPRISGVTGRPLVGDRWDDPRVEGGAKLAAALTEVWQQLRLVEILAIASAQASDGEPPCTFEIVTSGGTRIVWGAAPGREASAGELPYDQKRARLVQFGAQQGGLDSIDGPKRLDVRRELVVTPRTARNEASKATSDAIQAK